MLKKFVKFDTLNIILICLIQLGLSITQGVCVKSMYSFYVKKIISNMCTTFHNSIVKSKTVL